MPPIPEPGGNQRKGTVVAVPQECCCVRGPPLWDSAPRPVTGPPRPELEGDGGEKNQSVMMTLGKGSWG